MAFKNSNRREFVKAGSAALAATAVSWNASSYAAILGANDRVRVGVVGCGDRMKGALIPAFLQHAKEMNFEFVAVSDIWNRRREEGAAYIREARRRQRSIRCATTTSSMRARMSMRFSSPPPTSSMRCTASKPSKPAAMPMSKSPLPTPWTMRASSLPPSRRPARSCRSEPSAAAHPAIKRPPSTSSPEQFGDIVMVEMTWNVNQPGRWRRPDVVPLLKEEDTDWKRYLLNRPTCPSMRASILSSACSGLTRPAFPTNGWSTRSTPCTGSPGLPHPRSVVANGGIYLWKDGRQNWDTMTAVFDYGPLDDPTKGFQVQYTSRFTNSAGGVKELYYSNGGMIDMDKQTVTPTGGLSAKSAAEMGMKPNLLPSFSLVEHAEAASTAADTRRRSADLGQHAQLDGVRALAQNAQRAHRSRLQPLHRALHERGRHPDRPEGHLRRQDPAGDGREARSMRSMVGARTLARPCSRFSTLPLSPPHLPRASRSSPTKRIAASTSPSTASLLPPTSGPRRSRSPCSIRSSPMKASLSRAAIRSIRGPDERVDHPHHAGLWFNYGNVNGFDFWNNSDAIKPENRAKMGTILQTKIVSTKSGAERGELVVDRSGSLEKANRSSTKPRATSSRAAVMRA